MSEKEKVVKEIINYIEASIKGGLDEFEFTENFEDMLKNYLEGRLK